MSWLRLITGLGILSLAVINSSSSDFASQSASDSFACFIKEHPGANVATFILPSEIAESTVTAGAMLLSFPYSGQALIQELNFGGRPITIGSEFTGSLLYALDSSKIALGTYDAETGKIDMSLNFNLSFGGRPDVPPLSIPIKFQGTFMRPKILVGRFASTSLLDSTTPILARAILNMVVYCRTFEDMTFEDFMYTIKKFTTLRPDTQSILEKARHNLPIDIPFALPGGKVVLRQVLLHPVNIHNDIRDLDTVNTFEGTIIGEEQESHVSLFITAQKIVGSIFSKDGWSFIEPVVPLLVALGTLDADGVGQLLSKFGLESSDHIIYNAQDNEFSFDLGRDIASPLGQIETNNPNSNVSGITHSNGTISVTFDGDSLFFSHILIATRANGNISKAGYKEAAAFVAGKQNTLSAQGAEAINIAGREAEEFYEALFMQVRPVFLICCREMLFSVTLVTKSNEIWVKGGPNSDDAQTLLNSMAIFPHTEADVIHLLTGHDLDGNTLGIAWMAGLGTSSNHSLSTTTRNLNGCHGSLWPPSFSCVWNWTVHLFQAHLTVAHEIGHVLGARHTDCNEGETKQNGSCWELSGKNELVCPPGFNDVVCGKLKDHGSGFLPLMHTVVENGLGEPSVSPYFHCKNAHEISDLIHGSNSTDPCP
jgi:hypothetical protein